MIYIKVLILSLLKVIGVILYLLYIGTPPIYVHMDVMKEVSKKTSEWVVTEKHSLNIQLAK